MTVEFIRAVNVWESSELYPKPGGRPDPKYISRYARLLEDSGFDYTLVAYHSAGYDPFTVSATIAAATEEIKPAGRRTSARNGSWTSPNEPRSTTGPSGCARPR